MDKHPGIRIDAIPASGGAGMVFALGMVALILIGIPAARPFMAAAGIVGVLAGLALYRWRP